MTMAPDDTPLSARIAALHEQAHREFSNRDCFTNTVLSLIGQVLEAHLAADKALADYVEAANDQDPCRAEAALSRAAKQAQTVLVLANAAEHLIARERRR
jgi:hypothetical protein